MSQKAAKKARREQDLKTAFEVAADRYAKEMPDDWVSATPSLDGELAAPEEVPGPGAPLMLTQGQQAFEDAIYRTEPGKFKFPNRREMGHQVTAEAPTKMEETLAHYRAWLLPANFCIDCGKNDIVPKRGPDGTLRLNPGFIVVDRAMPEIDLEPNDVIVHFTCHDCMDTENWREPNAVLIPSGVHWETAYERRDRQAIEWCKAAKLRGESPQVHKQRR